MSDSLRERKGQCERCRRWREGVDRATDWTCSECRLRERCDELERENAALREQLADSEHAAIDARNGELYAGDVAEELGREYSRLTRGLIAYRGLIDGQALAHATTMEMVAAERNKACHEREAALCRASEATQECGRMEARLEHTTALLHECREWLIAGGPSCTKLGYVEFRKQLDAALDGHSTYPYDTRPQEERKP